MNSERMKKFISLLLAGSMALGLLLPGVSAFAEDGDEQPSSEPSVAQTLVEKITEAAAAAAQNESPPTPETPSQPDTPPQGDPEPLSESPGEPPAPHEGTDPEPDAPGVTEDPAQPEPPREEEPATPAPPEEEKPPEEPTPAEQKEKEQELEEARAHRSDPAADVEIPSEWAAMFEKLDLTGKYPDDLLAVARTQIGYTESEANYAEADGQRRGYTRYGAWNQDPYAPWNLTFVAFCLEYAQVPEDAFPREADPETWRQTLTEQNLWTTEAPKPGDVAFLPKDPETAIEEETEAALVGIVDEIEEDGTLWVIAGDMENEVRRIELASDQIIGFGVLPPGEERQDPQPPDPASTDVPADNGEPPADYDAPQDPLDPADPAAPVGDLAGDLAQRIAEGLARTGGDGQPPNGPDPPGEDGGSPDEPEEKPPDDPTGEDPVEPLEDLPEEPEGEPELPAEEELVEELPEELPFLQTQTLDGVTVTVTAEPGVFPEGAVLSVTKVPVAAQITVDAAVAPQRDGGNVALSYTFDVSILDAEGNPIQPADDQTVQVSFSMAQVADANLAPRVYHLAGEGEDLSARPLDVTTDGDTATVTTDGFSFYTVEFTYGDLQYVMEGDTTIPLDYILDYVGLTGEVTDVTVSAPELFNAFLDDGVWYVEALEAFESQEWMKVTIGGVVYEIVVTDAVTKPAVYNPSDYESVVNGVTIYRGADGLTFAQAAPITTILIHYDQINGSINAVPTIISQDKGFTTVPASSLSLNTVHDRSGQFVVYDNKVVGAVHSKFDKGSDNYFDGDLFSFTYPNAATLEDGSSADVILTYSNLHIVTQTNLSGDNVYSGQTYIASGDLLRGGNSIVDPYDTNPRKPNLTTRNGLRVDVNIQVKKKNPETGVYEEVHGTFLYPITDIDVWRGGISGFDKLKDADENNSFSEQIAIRSGIDGGIYLPDYRGINDSSHIGYRCAVDAYGDGVRFIGIGLSDLDPGTFYSGFITVADNSTGINITAWTSGSILAATRTTLLNGTTRNMIGGSNTVIHRIKSSTTAGGNIQTTEEGNQSGKLDDKSKIIGPTTKVVPDGKTVVYTMTPNTGFTIDAIQIGDAIDSSDNLIYVGRDQLLTLEENPKTKISVSIATGRIGMLRYDSDNGTYTFEFPDNNYDHKIHVSWITDLTLSKQVDGYKAEQDRYFQYTVKLELVDVVTQNDGQTFPINVSSADHSSNPQSIKINKGQKAATVTVYLKHGQSIKFLDLPCDTQYTITEMPVIAYNPTYSVNQEPFVDGETVVGVMSKPTSVLYRNISYWGDELPSTGGVGLPLLIKLALGSIMLTPAISGIKRKWGVGS